MIVLKDVESTWKVFVSIDCQVATQYPMVICAVVCLTHFSLAGLRPIYTDQVYRYKNDV